MRRPVEVQRFLARGGPTCGPVMCEMRAQPAGLEMMGCLGPDGKRFRAARFDGDYRPTVQPVIRTSGPERLDQDHARSRRTITATAPAAARRANDDGSGTATGKLKTVPRLFVPPAAVVP